MILVDTSVWIDHLHRGDRRLQQLLLEDHVWTHVGVVEELAVGSMRNRATVLELMGALRFAPDLHHAELMAFVDSHRLWGRGLGVVDVRLLGAARLARIHLWTRDKGLMSAADDLGVERVREDLSGG